MPSRAASRVRNGHGERTTDPLLDGVWLERSREALVIRSTEPLEVLSSAVVGGGRRRARSIINMHVPLSYDCSTPERDLRAFVRRSRLPAPSVGMMTAVATEDGLVLGEAPGSIEVRSVVTVGLANLTRAGEEATERGAAGTINAIFLLDASLRDAAALDLAVIAAEAKASVLAEREIRTAAGSIATGTSTDAVVVAWRPRSTPRLRYGGSATLIGAAVARLMRQAMSEALARREPDAVA